MEKRGRPKKNQAAQMKKIKDVLDEDRRQTVQEIAEKVGLSKSAIQRLLSDELSMSRISALWVSRLLTKEGMCRPVSASREFLKRHKRDPNFLDKIVTMDETWLHYFEPEGKRQSSVWESSSTPPQKKAKMSKCQSLWERLCLWYS